MHMIIFCNVVHKPLHNATFGVNVIHMKYDHRYNWDLSFSYFHYYN